MFNYFVAFNYFIALVLIVGLPACGKVKDGDELFVADNPITQSSKGAGVKGKPNAATSTIKVVPIGARLGKATGKIIKDKDVTFYEFVDDKSDVMYVIADVVNVYSPESVPPDELFVEYKKYSFRCKNVPYWSAEKSDMDTKSYTWDVYYPQFYSSHRPDAFSRINKDMVPNLTQEDCQADAIRYEVEHFNDDVISYRVIMVMAASGLKGSFTARAFSTTGNRDVQTGKYLKLSDIVTNVKVLNAAAVDAFLTTGLYNTSAEQMKPETKECIVENYIRVDWDTPFNIKADTMLLWFNLDRYDCETIGADSGPFDVPVSLEKIRSIVKPGALKYFGPQKFRIEKPNINYGLDDIRP